MNVFIAAPISGFKSDTAYQRFRANALALIELINRKHSVTSEIIDISNSEDYGTPEESVEKDFKNIEISDLFLLIHPERMQTSSLIELGYACALNKPIIIVSKLSDLPYLSLGLGCKCDAFTIVEGAIDCDLIREKVVSCINSWNDFLRY